MFTGIIEDTGAVKQRNTRDGGLELHIDISALSDSAAGDSIAVNGVCLTIEEMKDGVAVFYLSRETLDRTYLDELGEGEAVNLETALTLRDGLDGHLVQGHVDTVASIDRFTESGEGVEMHVELPGKGERYLVEKGSVALDGVSLTVAELHDEVFSVALIPETMGRTNLGSKEVGGSLNVEFDVVSKYVEKQVEGYLDSIN